VLSPPPAPPEARLQLGWPAHQSTPLSCLSHRTDLGLVGARRQPGARGSRSPGCSLRAASSERRTRGGVPPARTSIGSRTCVEGGRKLWWSASPSGRRVRRLAARRRRSGAAGQPALGAGRFFCEARTSRPWREQAARQAAPVHPVHITPAARAHAGCRRMRRHRLPAVRGQVEPRVGVRRWPDGAAARLWPVCRRGRTIRAACRQRLSGRTHVSTRSAPQRGADAPKCVTGSLCRRAAGVSSAVWRQTAPGDGSLAQPRRRATPPCPADREPTARQRACYSPKVWVPIEPPLPAAVRCCAARSAVRPPPRSHATAPLAPVWRGRRQIGRAATHDALAHGHAHRWWRAPGADRGARRSPARASLGVDGR
jgi:hypothetical protein